MNSAAVQLEIGDLFYYQGRVFDDSIRDLYLVLGPVTSNGYMVMLRTRDTTKGIIFVDGLDDVFLGELGAETFIECKRTAGSVHALMEFVGGAEKEKKTKTD